MSSVLYDVPGPKARRRYLIGTIVASVVVLALIVWVVLRLAAQDQFDPELWSPLFNPTNDDFPLVWARLGSGLWNTLQAAFFAMVFSLVIGTILAVLRVTSNVYYRWLVVGLIELLRGLPVVVLIFFAGRALPEIGIDLPILWFVVIGLTAYNSVIIAEIVRAGINSLPRGQGEAATAIGMTRLQSLRLILLPQAFRVMLPTLISQLVVILKDTSLGFILSYPELLQTGQIVLQVLRNPIQMYLLVAILFILINYALSKLAEYVERRLSRSVSSPSGAAPEEELAMAGAKDGG